MSLVRLKQLAQEGASDGQAAVWNNSTSQWEPASPAHGDQSGGTLHALAVAAGAAGFMSGADKTKLDGLSGGVGTIDQSHVVGLTTTTSASPVVIPGMTLIPAVTGDYLFLFSTTVSNTTNNQLLGVSIWINGFEMLESIRELDGVSANDQVMLSTMMPQPVTGGQTVDVRWRTSGGTLTAYNRSLVSIKVTV